MSELRGIYTLWLREVKKFFRDRSRLVSSVVTPVLWLVIFGSGLRFSQIGPSDFNYQVFLFPGIIGQTILFTAMFMGISVIWDRQFGFMKEILVSPISRVSIFTGKMLGVGTSALIQGLIVLALGFLIGVPLSIYMVGMTIPLMILIAIGMVCIGLTMASYMTSLESFGTIATFVNMPMFFLSGALFPVTALPWWMKWIFYVNPLTYGVDSLRAVIMPEWQPLLPLGYDIAILVVFDIVMIAIGTYAFSRRQ